MTKSLWITLPISLFCLFAKANTVTVATSTPSNTLAAPAPATSTTAPKKEEAPSVKYSMFLGAEYDLQAEAQKDGARDQGLVYSFSPAIAYDEFRLSLFEMYSQNLIDQSGSYWIDPVLTLSKKAWELGKYFKLGPSGSLTLPMTAASKDNTGLAYVVGGKLALILNTKNLGLDALSTKYSVAVTKQFTDYATNLKGEPNLAQRLRQELSVGYDIIDSLSVGMLFRFDSNYSVEGIVKNKFLITESIDYTLNKVVSFSLGHGVGGDTLKGDNYENNIKFYDSENSGYSFGININI